jgi:prepilin peptidase CpaA
MFSTPHEFSAATPAGLAAAAVFGTLLTAACVTDARERRIPNRLVVVLLVAGLLNTLVATRDVGSLGRSLAAGALGFAIWIPFYALRMLGAGDVKLFAAAAVWLAPGQVLYAAVYASLFGCALSVLWISWSTGPRTGWCGSRSSRSSRSRPCARTARRAGSAATPAGTSRTASRWRSGCRSRSGFPALPDMNAHDTAPLACRSGALASGPCRPWTRRLLRSERGAVLVEFGIVAPIMALLTCAIIDFSMAMFTLNNLTIAVREGGRVAAVMPNLTTNDPAVLARVRQSLAAQFRNTPATYTITVDREFRPGRRSATSRSAPKLELRPITPMARFFMSTVNMNRAVVFRSEMSNPP